MLIGIDGANFVNKGAEMMLRETVQRVRENVPGASLAVSSRTGPYLARAELGLYQIPRFPRFRLEWGRAFRLLRTSQRRSLGLVMNHELDAVLDASGYRYSEIWSPRNLRKLARRTSESRRQGKRFVLLPQALGPFSDRSRGYLATVIENIDILYARDETSYNYITEAVGESPNVRMAPDFTLPLPGFLRAKHEVLRGRSCLIPNRRMLDKTTTTVRDAYIPLMRKCLERLVEHHTNPFVLIHENRDEDLAREIVGGLTQGVDILKESDARAIKGIIGVSGAVISSRYHGLVNALSQGVPALGTEWSHKYEMLFRDYGFEEGLISIPTKDCLLDRKLYTLLDDCRRARLTAQFRAVAERQRVDIESMWDEVFAVLKLG